MTTFARAVLVFTTFGTMSSFALAMPPPVWIGAQICSWIAFGGLWLAILIAHFRIVRRTP